MQPMQPQMPGQQQPMMYAPQPGQQQMMYAQQQPGQVQMMPMAGQAGQQPMAPMMMMAQAGAGQQPGQMPQAYPMPEPIMMPAQESIPQAQASSDSAGFHNGEAGDVVVAQKKQAWVPCLSISGVLLLLGAFLLVIGGMGFKATADAMDPATDFRQIKEGCSIYAHINEAQQKSEERCVERKSNCNNSNNNNNNCCRRYE
jgi:hypothetical protein